MLGWAIRALSEHLVADLVPGLSGAWGRRTDRALQAALAESFAAGCATALVQQSRSAARRGTLATSGTSATRQRGAVPGGVHLGRDRHRHRPICPARFSTSTSVRGYARYSREEIAPDHVRSCSTTRTSPEPWNLYNRPDGGATRSVAAGEALPPQGRPASCGPDLSVNLSGTTTGGPRFTVAMVQDIAERSRCSNGCGSRPARPLTGLANRTLFLRRARVRCCGRPYRCRSASLDLDGFKAINDTLGPPHRRPTARRGRGRAWRRWSRSGWRQVVSERLDAGPDADHTSWPGSAVTIRGAHRR